MSDATGAGLQGDDALRTAVSSIRSHWRRRRLLEGAPVLVAAAIVALLAGVALRSTLNVPGTITALTRIIGYSLLAIAALGFVVRPWLRRANDEEIALYVEEQAPELRQLFLSAVHQLHEPLAAGSSPALRNLVVGRAVAEMQRLENGAIIERPRARRAVSRFMVLAAAIALMLALGPAVLRDVARVLFVPWATAAASPVPALSVAPGNVSVPRGAALDVRAELRAAIDHGAEIVMRPDSSDEWVRVPMVHDSTGVGYVARLFDINRNTVYYVESGGMRSPDYRITVTDLPTVRLLSLELHYPAYTHLPVQKIENGGDVVAVSQTTVLVDVTPTLTIAGGALHFDDGSSVTLTAASDGHLTGSFKVTHDGFYRIDMVASNGTKVPGTVQHSVEVLVDHPPTIRIEKPGRDTRVSSIDEVAVAVRAADDYGVRDVALHFSVNGGPDRVVPLADSTGKGSIDFSAVHTLFLEEMSLHVGDLVAYHATAHDGAGNSAKSDIYFMAVRPFGKDYHSADDNGGGGGGGGGGNNPGKFTERERQIVAGTFNWQRDSATTSDRNRRANATTLAISQGKLRADVSTQSAQMQARGAQRADSTFVLVMAELDSAAIAMKPAADGLGRFAMADAVPAEERALQHLQAADEAYRDITVRQQQQQGGGGGGGGGSAPQDLADLFELQTDKLKNQYETPRTDASGTPAQQAIDSTAEKLKELAARQQAENERAQRAADALQQRMPGQAGAQGSRGQQGSAGGQQGNGGQQGGGQQGGGQQANRGQQLSRSPSGGGPTGSAQREIARQAEEQARQLEKLSRDQNSPELADAAQKLQQAADAMRQAAAGSAQQGSTALDRLRQATQNLAGANSAAEGQAIQELARRASELGQQQQSIAHDVASPAAAAQQRAQLEQRKDELANGVKQLADDAQRVAQQTRHDQPKAAAAAQTAADEIRSRQVTDEINYSKRLIGDSSMAGSARNLENQIRETLDSVAQRLNVAAGSVGLPREQQQTAALDRTRDLVRDLQSLRDRTTGNDGQPAGTEQARQGEAQASQPGQRGATSQGQPGQQGQGQQGQRGQNGQRGQQGQQGQGQQGQQGQGQGQAPGQGRQGQPGEGRGQQAGQGQGQGQGPGQQPGQGQQSGNRSGGRIGGGNGVPNGQFTPGGIGDPRQFQREVAARQQSAESLRRDLQAQGVDVRPLDLTIDQLKQLQGTTNPGRADELQAAIVAGLKDFEFNVWRKFNGADLGSRPALGAAAQVPPEYRALVEEYYRSLARKGPN